MPVRYLSGIRKGWRKWLHQLRNRLPQSLRLRVWKRTGTEIFAQKGYLSQTPLFQSIEIETRTRCNSSCAFCAASILTDKRPDLLMSEEIWAKTLSDLEALDYGGVVKFFVNNEPLLDPHLARRVGEVRTRLTGARTEVHSNGLKLNARNGRELLEAGLHTLVINNYSTDGTMHRGVKAFLDEVAPDFPQVEIVYHQRLLVEKLQNRGGTAPNAPALPSHLALTCILPFEELILTADGRVTLCCQDHDFSHAVGNIRTRSLKEIWFGSELQTLRQQLGVGQRQKHPLCAACDFRGYKDEHIPPGWKPVNRRVGNLWKGD